MIQIVTRSVLIMCICLFLGNLGWAQSTSEENRHSLSYNQNAAVLQSSNPSITVEFNKVNLDEALKIIGEKARAGIYFNTDLLPNKKISLKMEEAPLGEVLHRVMEGTGLEVYTSGRNILLREVKKQPNLQTRKIQQLETVSGTVTDAETNEALPGVNVVVKGTTQGTATGPQGSFKVSVPSLQDTLMFSFIGYKTKEVPIKGRTEINISLTSTSISGEEIVVVGYGEQKKENLTGSVTTADVDQIEHMPVSNLSAALRYSDLLPGVHVNGGQSRPGEAGSITLRNPPEGAKNGGDNSPLYVIDDVVRTQQDFNLLDPSQIKSISVVKDATAAIYGARAAQGVILVETKRGERGAPRISYSGSTGLSDATYTPNMMSGYQQAKYLNDMLITRGRDSSDPSFYTQDELDYYKKYNYDWFNMAWKPSMTTRHSLSVSGGGDRATYFANASYYYGDGNVNKIHYQKWNLQAGATLNVADHVKVGLNLSGVLDNRKWFFLKQGGENPERDVTNLYQTPQFVPPYVNGQPVELPAGVHRGEGLHFFAVQNLDNYTKSNNHQLNVNTNIEYDVPFVKGLTANLVFNKNLNSFWGKQYGTYYDLYQFSMQGQHNHIYAGQVTQVDQAKNGDRVRINPSYTSSYQLNARLNYDQQFGKHHVSLMALAEQAESYDEGTASMQENVAVDDPYMKAALGTMTTTNSAHESGTLSYAGRVNYQYDDRYIAEFDWRYDSSTKFAPDYRWGFFPALSVAWIISNEKFFNEEGFVNFLKIRGSAGRLGRDRTRAWDWFQRYTLQQGGHGAVFGGNSDRDVGIKLEKLPNAFVTWDKIEKYNVGLDFRMLDDRLSVTMDGYFDHGYDLLTNLNSNPPITVGSQMPAENYSITNSMGYELSVQWNGQIGDEFNYSVTTGLGYENSKIIKYDVAAGDVGTWRDRTGLYTRNLGSEGYIYKGMFRTQEEVDNYLKDHPDYTIFGMDPKPGMLYYEDLRGPKQEDGSYAPPDGKITEDDRTYIRPKRGINKGLSFTASWKGLQAHVKTSFSVGSESEVPGGAIGQASTRSNLPAFWADHWTPENTDAAYPAPWYHDNYERNSSFWYRRSDSFRIDLIKLSYNLPQMVLSQLGVRRLNVYMVATNPLNIQRNRELLGYSLRSYPELRTVSFGINLNL